LLFYCREREALTEIEDQIEAAQARLNFQDERILNLAQADDDICQEVSAVIREGSAKSSSSPASDVEADRNIMDVESLPQAKVAMHVLFNMVVGLKREERTNSSACAELQVQIKELQAALQASEDAVKVFRLEQERRMTEIKREQSGEMDTLLRLAAFSAPLAGDQRASKETSVLAVASPAELISMLKTTKDRHDAMQEEVSAQQEVIINLQRERESLRDEINRLSTIALRQQEAQQRRLSVEAKKGAVPAGGLSIPEPKKGSHRHRHSHHGAPQPSLLSPSTPMSVQGLKIGAMWGPSGLTEAAVSAPVAQSEGPQKLQHGLASNVPLTKPPAPAVSSITSLSEDHSERDSESSPAQDHADHDPHRDQARAWWSERGINPVHSSRTAVLPPPILVDKPVTAPFIPPVTGKSLYRKVHRGEPAMRPVEIISTVGSAGLLLDTRRAQRYAKLESSKPSGVTLITDLTQGMPAPPELPKPIATGDNKMRRSVSSKFRAQLGPAEVDTSLSVVGRTAAAASGEPMHVRTTMSDIMSPTRRSPIPSPQGP
jgi:hypothetical protein